MATNSARECMMQVRLRWSKFLSMSQSCGRRSVKLKRHPRSYTLCHVGTATRSKTCLFFSSRRRHTRYWRDWSSDVCSSDLVRRESIQESSWASQMLSGFGDIQSHRQVGTVPYSISRKGEKSLVQRRRRDRLQRLGVIELEIGRASCRERV